MEDTKKKLTQIQCGYNKGYENTFALLCYPKRVAYPII